MSDASESVLIGDIGGTNARFALARDGGWTELARLKVAGFADARSALAQVLQRAPKPMRAAVLAVAGPVSDGQGQLTNGAWTFDAGALAGDLGLRQVLLVNDFAAQALALPHLAPEDSLALGGPDVARSGETTLAILGPGTGLGVAALLADGTPLIGEGGHVTLPARDAREWRIVEAMARHYGHVSAERVLSGAGLLALQRLLAERRGEATAASPEAVTEAARQGAPAASEAVELFLRFLGTVAGDVALTFGARGGVFLTGGILPHLRELARGGGLREAFLSKGRFRGYLDAIPLRMVVHPDPAFLGLARHASKL